MKYSGFNSESLPSFLGPEFMTQYLNKQVSARFNNPFLGAGQRELIWFPLAGTTKPMINNDMMLPRLDETRRSARHISRLSCARSAVGSL